MKNFYFFYNIIHSKNTSIPPNNVVNAQVGSLIGYAMKYTPVEWSLFNDALWGRAYNAYSFFCAHYILSSCSKEKIKEYRNLLTLQEYNINFIELYSKTINNNTYVDDKVFNKLKQLNLTTLINRCDVDDNNFLLNDCCRGDAKKHEKIISYLYDLVAPELESGILSRPFRDIYNEYIRGI